MSLIEKYSQNILGFRGNIQEAGDIFKNFLSDTLLTLFNIDQKYQRQIFMNCHKNWNVVENNLKNYFENSPLPIQNIFSDNKYKNEGFLSSDDEEQIKTNKKVIIKRTQSILQEPPKENCNFKDEQIKIRDQVIQDMTIGYYKDIQHLKEMFTRKERTGENDYVDATYYDISKTFPEEVQIYIHSKIKEVTNQAKLQQSKLQTTISQQSIEIEKMRKTINQLISQADIQQQIKAILLIDRDLYKFWRGIQDVIGNKTIFEIFEKRQNGYGIDYRQIDELISSSQAYYRVYQEYQKKIDEQYILFTTQVGQELIQLKQQIQILTDKQTGTQQEKESDYVQIRQTIKSGIEYIYEMKEQAYQINFQQKLESYVENIVQKEVLLQVKKCVKGHALFKWLYLARIEKIQKYKKLRRNQSLNIIKQEISTNPRGILDQRMDELKGKLKLEQNALAEEQLQSQQLNIELNQLKNKYQGILMNYEMQLHKYLFMQQYTIQLENQNKYFEKIFSLLMRRIGYPTFEINIKNIKFILEKSDQQMKLFGEKINKIQYKEFEDIKELTTQFLKRSIVYNKIYKNYQATCYTQTDIFDVSQELEECIKLAKQNSFQLQQIEEQQLQQLKEEEEQNQQDIDKELELQLLDDIPNVLLSEKEDELEQNQQQQPTKQQSNEIDTTNIQTDYDINMNHPKTADNKSRTQQFTFISKRKIYQKPFTKTKEIQTDIQVDCSINLVNKIFINDLDEYKKNVKEKYLFKDNKKQTPQQLRPDIQNTFATLISQQNVNRFKNNNKKTNSFLQSHNHKPIEINCKSKLRTDLSDHEILSNITFTNDRIKIVYTPGKNKLRSMSKNT